MLLPRQNSVTPRNHVKSNGVPRCPNGSQPGCLDRFLRSPRRVPCRCRVAWGWGMAPGTVHADTLAPEVPMGPPPLQWALWAPEGPQLPPRGARKPPPERAKRTRSFWKNVSFVSRKTNAFRMRKRTRSFLRKSAAVDISVHLGVVRRAQQKVVNVQL